MAVFPTSIEKIEKTFALLDGQTFSIDTETTGLQWAKEKVIGISLHCPTLGLTEYLFTCTYELKPTGKVKKKRVWAGEYEISEKTGRKVKIWKSEETREEILTAVSSQEHCDAAITALRKIAKNPETKMVFHNFKFDAHMLRLNLQYEPCMLLDTTVMIHLLDSRLPKGMEQIEPFILGSSSKRQHVTKAPPRLKQWNWSPEVIEDYAKNDAVVTYQFAEKLMPSLRKLRLIPLFKLQMEYLKVLTSIEERGMVLNKEFCNQASEVFTRNLEQMEQEMADATGLSFNWRSAKELSNAIYDNLGILRPKNPFADEDGVDRSRMAHKGKYNKFATSSFLLMEKAKHPLGPLIQDLRETYKLRSNIAQYEEVAVDGIVYGNFNLVRTRTGRLSSSEPNLQNVPSEHRVRETQSVYSGGSIRTHEYNLRQAFTVRPGYTMCSIDMAQQEMRLFAILAQEPIMLEALRNRQDIHLMIAIAVWGDCGKELNKLHREWSKTIAFG